MKKELLYQIALTLVPNIGPVQAKILLQSFEPSQIFNAKLSDLERMEGIGTVRAKSIKIFDDFAIAEKEIAFIEKMGIQPFFITDPSYPQRLLNCYDAPTLLYCRGKADLNASKMIAVIGTRNHTDYGKQMTEQIVTDLVELGITVVSGLAFGIDALAHKAALKHGLPTIAVLAHGLDQLYPSQNAALAKEMIKHNGGLLTEFTSGTKPDKHNFPMRNRIVAGISDAAIVIETGIKGGSMITAELANGYNKDVFAVPGRNTDNKSSGCNELIRNNKAVLLGNARELIQWMGWEDEKPQTAKAKPQRELFIELSSAEKIIVELLRDKTAGIDEINLRSGLSNGTVASAILNLELHNVIVAQPGKRYSLA